ncbi:hypothetical protein ABFT80_08150 [Mesorhizobium sp. SB112]|uniref:hypothetical protein n=1 Tax=Mesorhizobium sp. SB112 TaxID=3151853 RepID=UPI003267C7F0
MTDALQMQADIARAVAQCVSNVNDGEWGDREWLRLVVNFEGLWSSKEPVTSSISFAIARNTDGSLEKVSFRLSPDTKAKFASLAETMKGTGGSAWTVSDLVIENDGRYNFQFSYDPPYRLGGNLHDKRFLDYLDRHRAEFVPD